MPGHHIDRRERLPQGNHRQGYHCERLPHVPDYSGADVEQSYSQPFEKLLALSLIAFIAILGPFQPMISSFLSSSSSVAMKNFSSSCRIGFDRSRTSRRPCSECDRRGTANRRSFLSALPLLFCSICRMPMMRQVSTTPGNVAASWITMMSRG